MASRDFYQVLGIPDSASADDIKKVYRKLAKQYHPDANPNNPSAVERFKEISEAHTTLSDPEQRKKYDQMRRLGAFTSSAPRRPRGPGPGQAGGGPGFETDGGDGAEFDLGNLGGLGDIFSSIFGRTRRDEGRPEIETVVEVPFRIAALGGKVSVRIPVTETCRVCGGSGAAPGAKVTTCVECNGRGAVTFGQGNYAVSRPCPRCRGKGKVPSMVCGNCQGAGEVRLERNISITVPAGTVSGGRVRLAGQGTSNRPGEPPGDLVVTFQVQPDRFFHRDGIDLICEVPINLAQAVLGTRLRVRTLDGKKVLLKIPAGTQPGRKFRIKGLGLEKGGRKGDQLVTVQVQLPEKLTPEQEEAFARFAEGAELAH